MKTIKAAAIVVAICALAACDQLQSGGAAPEAAAPEASAPEAMQAATGEAFVGTWAVDTASCQIPQEQQGAPHIFTSDGYDQHEAHCTFANVARTGPNSWRIDAACQVEGDEASLGWDVTVDGDTMTTDPGGRLVRCP
jgi:hypothetical protein